MYASGVISQTGQETVNFITIHLETAVVFMLNKSLIIMWTGMILSVSQRSRVWSQKNDCDFAENEDNITIPTPGEILETWKS